MHHVSSESVSSKTFIMFKVIHVLQVILSLQYSLKDQLTWYNLLLLVAYSIQQVIFMEPLLLGCNSRSLKVKTMSLYKINQILNCFCCSLNNR